MGELDEVIDALITDHQAKLLADIGHGWLTLPATLGRAAARRRGSGSRDGRRRRCRRSMRGCSSSISPARRARDAIAAPERPIDAGRRPPRSTAPSRGGSPASRCTASSAFASSTACAWRCRRRRWSRGRTPKRWSTRCCPSCAAIAARQRPLPHPRSRHRHRRHRAGAAQRRSPRRPRPASTFPPDALATARAQCRRHWARRPLRAAPVRLVRRQLTGSFDVIVSNPPYIPSRRDRGAAARGPRFTIRAGRSMAARTGSMPTGRSPTRRRAHLEPGGIVAVEIGYDQRMDVDATFRESRLSSLVGCSADLGGNDRVLLFRAR